MISGGPITIQNVSNTPVTFSSGSTLDLSGTIGIAIGTVPLSGLMARTGRRPGTSVGLLVSGLAALLAAGALQIESFILLTVATFVFGFGAAADRLVIRGE